MGRKPFEKIVENREKAGNQHFTPFLTMFSTISKKMAPFKSGYLDFSHLPELKYIYIKEIYLKKEYKSSRIKNHKITNKNILMVFP